MQLVDSHCHINFSPLGEQLPQVLQNAKNNSVEYMLCVSVNLEDFPQVHALAGNFPHIFASVGVHPNERDGQDPAVEELVRLASDSQVIAIGETGLDYYRSEGDLSWQRERFRRHIRAAKECAKPLLIHMRDAAHDTLQILRDERADEVGGVMHCFSETWETAQQALALNFYISFSGIVTFKNAEALRAVATKVPADRLLIETDSPYLAPVPYRGKTNEPAYVRYVAECLANLRQVPLEIIAAGTTNNFFTLFRSARAS
ncbi:MAG TPA: TatD family hydrolase [Acidiferrobacterales bacterium]|nr:TatD family hydrolase [Acidiferrobacterales bacterium]